MGTSYRIVTDPASPHAEAPHRMLSFEGGEWRRLAALYGVVVLLHVAGWGLYLYHAPRHPALVGLGFAAYLFGLRHAFDADHIAAVDDTVRYMLQKGKRPLGIGFFFSLGHSTIVLALAVAIIVATSSVTAQLPAWRALGSVIGAGVSATFLWAIGILNLIVLLDLLKVWRQAKNGSHAHAHVDELLRRRGFINRLLGSRLRRFVSQSWQMYPLGVLFGLGFDTASEVGLLVMTAGASAGALPVTAILSLPLLFTAGMTILDTTDGVLMLKAYDWAFVNPLRTIVYNVALTGVSVALAIGIGTIEALQVAVGLLHLEGPVVDFAARIDFGMLGYAIVAGFVGAWVVCAALWRFGRIDERHGKGDAAHAHVHRHEGGVTHSHRHFH